jgi:hypothetical protein
MIDIKGLGLRHLRSFGADKNIIPLKKINILIGKNSCGKSTFLRTFPLLRQSIEAATRSPILWFGKFVDFGDFSTALNSDGNSIFFDFDIKLNLVDDNLESWDFEVEYFNDFGEIQSSPSQPTVKPTLRFPIDASLGLQKERDNLSSSFSISILGVELKIGWVQNRVIEFEAYCTHTKKTERLPLKRVTESGSLIPLKAMGIRALTVNQEKRFIYIDLLKHESFNMLAEYVKKHHHASKKIENIKDKLKKLPLSHGDTLLENLRILFSDDKYFIKKLETHTNEILRSVFFYLAIRNTSKLWSAVDSLFKEFFEGVRYSGPLRAAGERFYRYQDLEIDEIDHTGGNLPMVINSLKPVEKESLSIWIKENFGFELKLLSEGLHYELLIKEEADREFHNISDMGFGYSQILPVIVSIWLETVHAAASTIRAKLTKRKKWPRTIILEQPELHLHPALQYKFGSAIAKVATLANKKDFIFIIETHSKHLIDALGQSIRENELSEDQVNITLFEKMDDGDTETSLSGFDNEGYLINWPIGFLSA